MNASAMRVPLVLLACACGALACPPNFYGRDCLACPAHTACPEGSGSAHDCRCITGYFCIYYKQIRARVKLNTTMSAFSEDADGVRSAFLSAVASAAGVDVSKVQIRNVAPVNQRRALLPSGGSIHVDVQVVAQKGLDSLPDRLPGLHLGDTWVLVPRVLVLPI